MAISAPIEATHLAAQLEAPPAPTASAPRVNGYDTASCWSRTSFSYILPLLRLGNARTLQAADLDPLPRRDNISVRCAALAQAWEEEAVIARDITPPGSAATRRAPRWHLWRALYATNRGEFWTAALYCFLESFFCIVQPVLLGYLVRWLQEMADHTDGANATTGPPSHATGALLAVTMGACSFGQAVVHHQLYMYTMRGGFNMRMAVTGLVHAKLLRLSALALQQATSGKVINIVSNDVQRFDLFTPAIHFLWSAPLDLAAIITLVSLEVGAGPCFAGVAIVFVSVPLQGYFGKLFGRRRRITARLTDRRVATCAEVFSGMLSVKALGWEPAFAARVAAERAAETKSILLSQSIKAVNLTLQVITPALATFATFVAYWAKGGTLTLPVVFSTMSLLHALRLSIGKNWRRATESAPEAHVAVERIQQFLLLPEHNNRIGARTGAPPTLLLEVVDGAFSFGAAGAAAVFGSSGDGGGGTTSTNSSSSSSSSNQETADGGAAAATSQVAVLGADGGDGDFRLTGINVRVETGQLLCVVGAVGSGKSSFLLALCGELEQRSGSVHVSGGEHCVAYSAQSAFIFAGSVTDNITFGHPFDQRTFDRVAFACCLLPDFAALPQGAATEIGEKGVNLSGGQKARVSLARAAYATLRGTASVVLLDDPLSAVDVHVAAHIFTHCIKGILLQDNGSDAAEEFAHDEGRKRATCVVLATHHLQFVPQADLVLSLGRDGAMRMIGAPADVIAAGAVEGWEAAVAAGAAAVTCMEGNKGDALGAEESENDGGDAPASDAAAPSPPPVAQQPDATAVASADADAVFPAPAAPAVATPKPRATPVELIVSEERAGGKITGTVYRDYARAGGAGGVLVVFMLLASGQALVMMADNWLKVWVSRADQRDPALLWTYLALSLGAVAVCLLRALIFFVVSMRASSTLHNQSFGAVTAAPMSFFISHPVGRILNKFSSDQGEVDEVLPVTMYDCLQCLFMVVGSIVLSCIAVPFLPVLLAPLIFAFVRLRTYYLACALELKRLDQRSKSPIFAGFAASVAGVATIRAFGQAAPRQEEFVEHLEGNGKCWFAWLLANRWVGFRLDMLSALLLTATTVCAVELAASGSELVDPGLVGLSVVYALSLSGTFQYMVRQSAQVETMMSAVQRLLHYCQALLPEGHPSYLLAPTGGSEGGGGGAAEGAGAPAAMARRLAAPRVDAGAMWPTAGAIEVHNVTCRYRANLPPVLKGVSFSVAAGAKVGVVGRTGSGKSSFINALLRLNEVTGGTIEVDGVDTTGLALDVLRRGAALIPQEPHLFSGTLRFNLDPLGVWGDDALWAALKLVQMAAHVRGTATGLDMLVSEGGTSLSMGQRQLISLARACLKCQGGANGGAGRARLVCMDEATANVDYQTDELIQSTLREDSAFAGCTLVIVAHRIATVLDCDMIVVLEAGKVVEVGAPAALLAESSSIFATMAAKTTSKTNAAAEAVK